MYKKIVLISTVLFMAYVLSFAQTVSAPTNLTATLNTGHTLSVALQWEYPTSNVPVKFLVYKKLGAISDTGMFVKIFTTTSKRFFDNHVQPGKTFSYYVKASVGQVVSDPSNTVEILITPPVISYGKIFGTLTEDPTNTPISKGNVQFIPANKVGPCVVAPTDSFGNFFAKLLAGQYYIYSSAKGYIGEYFDNVPNIQQATMVTVNANDSLTFNIGLLKYQAPVTYTITGTVKDQLGNVKPAKLNLYLVNKRPSIYPASHIFSTRTDSLGNFKFSGLLLNDTVVIYITPFDKTFLPQYYNQKPTFADADRIVITGNVTGIDVVVKPKPVYANGISGFVKDSAGVVGLKGAVHAYRKTTTGGYVFVKYFVKTDTLTGEYSFTNLEPGQYILLANARGYKASYFRYDGTPTMDWKLADSVIVEANGVIPNINFNLRQIYHILLGGSNAPVVFGNIKEKSGLTVDLALTYLVDNNNEVIASSISELDGSFAIEGLTPGSYNLVTNAVNYQESNISEIDIDDTNNGNMIDVVLNPESVTSVQNGSVITNFNLSQNYPNPFNPSTKITYSIPKDGMVSINVFNAIGQKVATLVNTNTKAGSYEVTFDGKNLSSGIYFYSIKFDNMTITKKMMLIK